MLRASHCILQKFGFCPADLKFCIDIKATNFRLSNDSDFESGHCVYQKVNYFWLMTLPTKMLINEYQMVENQNLSFYISLIAGE